MRRISDKIVRIFEKAKDGKCLELSDLAVLSRKLKNESKIIGLLEGVEKNLITPKEAAEIIKDESGVVVLENQP